VRGTVQVVLHSSWAQLAIAIADCGPGLPDAELAKIFAPFYRVSTARERNSGGLEIIIALQAGF
jgi:signal transduction histidine kinase